MTELESHCQGHSYLLPWAIAIHKSQGITLEKATIDIGNKDFSSGLSFVAISRVKTLHGIAFWKSFGWARLQKPVTESMRMLEQNTAHWAGLGFPLDTYDMDLSEYVFNVN